MKITIEAINPAKAREFLRLNTNNRSIRHQHVDRLAADMANGRWQLTHQGIAISGEELVDGQHRLLAIIQSGATIEMPVARGANSETKWLVDTGSTRTGADALKWNGFSDVNNLSAASRAIIQFCSGHRNAKASNTQLIRVAREYQLEIETALGPLKTFKPARNGWVTGTFAFALRSHTSAIEQFLHAFTTGANCPAGSPALAARNYFINGVAANYSNGGNVRWAVEALFGAMLAHIQDRGMTLLKKGSSGLNFFLDHQKDQVAVIQREMAQQLP